MKTPKDLLNLLNKNPIKTWEDMQKAISLLSPEQRKKNITVELEYQDEFYPAEFRICGAEHSVLDDNYPIIFVKEY